MRGLGKNSVVTKIKQALDVMFLKLRIFATTIEKLCSMKEKESLIENKDQNHTEQEKDYKELDKLRREKTAGYFFTLSYLSFTALVLGSMAIFFQEMKFTYQTCLMLGMGLFFTGGLYYVASNFFKIRKK